MICRKDAVLLLTALGSALIFKGSEPRCCNPGSKAEITYDTLPADGFVPRATVTAISRRATGETIQIEASIVSENGVQEIAQYSTTNLGRT